MSTGADCVLEEREPGRWWYRLQRWPYGETPDYDEHGPFASEDRAHEHLHATHANPGGYSTVDHETYARWKRERAEREAKRAAERSAPKTRAHVSLRRFPR